MPAIDTATLTPEFLSGLSRQQNTSIYNALDCAVTLEVREVLGRQFNSPPKIYEFEKALQAPALEMMLRGFKIDQYERRKGSELLEGNLARLQVLINAYAQALWDRPLNPRSRDQLIKFFYGAMKLPEQWSSKKGQRKLSMDREALEKLEVYFHAMPIIAAILAFRDNAKQLQVLQTEVDADGRMRTSYNIAGTESGRWSSSKNSTGGGTNIQNISPRLRRMFVADLGWKLCGIDLEQAESRDVGWICGNLFNDWSYLDACESGDLHTQVCKMIWPGLPWTGDPKGDKAVANKLFYREFSYRDLAKRGGHGCLTVDHEVLTRNGWVPITAKPDEILIWSEGSSYFAPVQNWADFLYSGELHSFEGNSVSACMTAEHRVPYYSDVRFKLKTRYANQGPGASMPLGHGYVGGYLAPPARLVAAFMSDGNQKSINRMEFHLRKARKIKRIIQLCQEYGYEYTVGFEKITVTGALPKRPGAFMLDWSRQSILDFLDEYKYWNGHTEKTSVTLFSKHREDLEWIQTLGRICGIGGQIQKPQISGFGTKMWKLQQNNRKFASGSNINHTVHSTVQTRVLCPTVQSTWFYVRRNGRIFVTGNSNYLGTPFTMARHLKVIVKLMEDFQRSYFGAFPCIPKWHLWTAEQLQTIQLLETPFGRRRHFFGRPNDDTTLREAIAYVPQSSTADRMNLGLWRIWKYLGDRVQLLAQVHDAVYFQYRPADEAEIIPEALRLIEVELINGRRKFVIPGEAKVGWNWGNWSENNPDGLRKYSGFDPRERTTLVDRLL